MIHPEVGFCKRHRIELYERRRAEKEAGQDG